MQGGAGVNQWQRLLRPVQAPSVQRTKKARRMRADYSSFGPMVGVARIELATPTMST